VPLFEHITYTQHASDRMVERGISRDDVELMLRIGEGRPGKRGIWLYELGAWRVVTMEADGSARIITVIRLRGRE
jgi:hypothetical protein